MESVCPFVKGTDSMDNSTRFKDLVDGRRIPPHFINVLLFARGVASAPRPHSQQSLKVDDLSC